VATGDPRLAVVARYKLAWSHYRRDDYPEAIAAFQAVLDAGPGAPMARELRDEAAQYLAICLVELDRDGDGAADPAPAGARTTATVARIAAHLGDGSRADRRDVAERAAGVLRDELRLDEAAAVYHLVLAVTTDPVARARLEAALAGVAARRPRP
jgi:hypothetical protein